MSKHDENVNNRKKILYKMLPGMRMIKTSIAILICMLIEYYRGSNNLISSSITATLVMQANIGSSFTRSILRVAGVLFSGLYSLFFFYIMDAVFGVVPNSIPYIIFFALFSLPIMSLLNFFNLNSNTPLVLLYYILICFSAGAQSDPGQYVIGRMIFIFIGVSVSLFVNWFPPLNFLGSYYENLIKKPDNDK